MTPLRKRMLEELQLRNYAEFTIERYLDAVRSFAKFFHKSPDQLGPEQIREYLLYLVRDRKSAPSTVQVHRAALRFLYVKTLNQPWFDERVARTRKRIKLPTVLSAAEITRILDNTRNLKHWTMIATFYATGVRLNELRKLKVADIDSQRMVIHVREAKGGRPRDIGLSKNLLERLKIYWRWRKPQNWLFPSDMRSDQPLERKSIRCACSLAGRRAGIDRAVSPHVFRHYAASRTMPRVDVAATIDRRLNCGDAA
jgi:integrase/recombinase XerD